MEKQLSREISRYHHKNQNTQDNFYSLRTWQWTLLIPALSMELILVSIKIGCAFVPKFYLEKRARNFHKHLQYVGEYGPDNVRCEYPEI